MEGHKEYDEYFEAFETRGESKMTFNDVLKADGGLLKALDDGHVVRFLGQYKYSNTYIKVNENNIIAVYNKFNEFAAPYEGHDGIADEEVEILDHEPEWTDEMRTIFNLLDSKAAIEVNRLNIGDAIDFIKQGHKVARKCWVTTGTGMFLYYVPVGSYPARMESIKGMFKDDMVPYEAYIAKKTLRGTVEIWQASQEDLLAEDYVLVEL